MFTPQMEPRAAGEWFHCKVLNILFLSENEHRLRLFWSGIGYGFLEGTTGVYERINRASINTFMRIRNGFEEVFLFAL